MAHLLATICHLHGLAFGNNGSITTLRSFLKGLVLEQNTSPTQNCLTKLGLQTHPSHTYNPLPPAQWAKINYQGVLFKIIENPWT